MTLTSRQFRPIEVVDKAEVVKSILGGAAAALALAAAAVAAGGEDDGGEEGQQGRGGEGSHDVMSGDLGAACKREAAVQRGAPP